MDLDRLQSDLRRLAEIVGSWDASKEIDALERDLVLEKLRGLYETVRFGVRSETVPAEPAAAEPALPIDLGEVLSLDPLAEMPEAEEPLPEAASAFEEPVPFEPEPTSDPGPEVSAAPASEPVREAELSEEPIAPAVPSAEMSGPEPEPVSEPIGETPAPRDVESPAVEAFISASVAESAHEPAPSDPDANPDHSREKSAAQTLFGVEEPASRHRHKQRVIMSLYGPDTPERTPATPVGEAFPAEPAPEPAPAPAHEPVHPVHPVHPAAEAPTLSDAAAPGAVLGEVINANVHTLADTIAPPHDIASELRRSESVADLHRAIGINDKFLMIRDLFGGDGEAFERAIEALNGFDNLDDCMIYVAENYAWNANSDGAKLLMELLERKFA
ncbi:MAG TPA: hypothetical protein H9760_04585 [Candidatus Alistipes stercoravium]|nr:hypothetical protein [Candidatus Alistipes stercoravium]